MVGSQIRNDSGGIKVKVFLYNPLVNFLKLNNTNHYYSNAQICKLIRHTDSELIMFIKQTYDPTNIQ